MVKNAVISLVLALILACIVDGIPESVVPVVSLLMYGALGFGLVSGLLSLFEEAESGDLQESRDQYRHGY